MAATPPAAAVRIDLYRLDSVQLFRLFQGGLDYVQFGLDLRNTRELRGQVFGVFYEVIRVLSQLPKRRLDFCELVTSHSSAGAFECSDGRMDLSKVLVQTSRFLHARVGAAGRSALRGRHRDSNLGSVEGVILGPSPSKSQSPTGSVPFGLLKSHVGRRRTMGPRLLCPPIKPMQYRLVFGFVQTT